MDLIKINPTTDKYIVYYEPSRRYDNRIYITIRIIIRKLNPFQNAY